MDPLNILLWLLIIIIGVPVAVWVLSILFAIGATIIYVVVEVWKEVRK